MANSIKEFIIKYKWRIISVVLGLIFTILIFTIGFWRALLLLVILIACYFIGKALDNNDTSSITGLFKRKSDRN